MNASDTTLNVPAKTMSEERKDFVKRLFAVAISVGFATQISGLIRQLNENAGFTVSITSVTAPQWHELALLAASLVAVVGSWEGYLGSIYRDPLERPLRFYLDITIVFVYLLLMLFSPKSELWFGLFALMFAIYLVWDFVKMRERALRLQDSEAMGQGNPLHEHSAVITAVWLVAACALFHFKSLTTPFGFLFAWLAAVCIIVMYRYDKRKRLVWLKKAALLAFPFAFMLLSARLR